MFQILLRVFVLVAVSVHVLRAADPVVGTWTLDLKKSVFRPGPPPASQTRVYRESDHGVIATVVTVFATGKSTTVEFPANSDGQLHQVSGSPDIDGIQMRRVGPQRFESSLMHAGREIAKAVREVSDDGLMLTITYDSVSSDGEKVRNISVYRRQNSR